MKRPKLTPAYLHQAWPPKPGHMFITIDVGAWDKLIESAYNDGWFLVEIRNNKPVRAYQKPAHELRGRN